MRDVRLADDGTATITAEKIGGGFCSLLVGVDCHTRHVSCCFSLDEFVDGALFDSTRERLVTWSRLSDSLGLHAFAIGDASACCTLLHRFLVPCRTWERLQRIEWSGDRIIVWVGENDAQCSVCAFMLRAVIGSEPSGHKQGAKNADGDGDSGVDETSVPLQPDRTGILDASGLGRHWEWADGVPGRGSQDLSDSELSDDASWALLRPSAGRSQWEAIALRASEPAAVVLVGVLAACFAGSTSVRGACSFYALRQATDATSSGAIQLVRGLVSCNEATPTNVTVVDAPFLSRLPPCGEALVRRLAVRLSTTTDESAAADGDKHVPLAVWLQTDDVIACAAADDLECREYREAVSCDEADTPSSHAAVRIALGPRGAVVQRDGILHVVASAAHNCAAQSHGAMAATTTDGMSVAALAAGAAESGLALAPAASRPIHWAGTVTSRTGGAPSASEPTDARGLLQPAACSRFSFAESVREHLAFGTHLVAAMLSPHAVWTSSHLESQRLISFGWDRTSDHGDWPPNQPRFFRYDQYRTQNLSRRADLVARVPPDPQIVLTDGAKALAQRVLDGYKHSQPVLLEGEASGGKTSVVQFCAHRTNSPLTRFNLTPNTSIADFVGQLGLSEDTFSFCLGPFAEVRPTAHATALQSTAPRHSWRPVARTPTPVQPLITRHVLRRRQSTPF